MQDTGIVTKLFDNFTEQELALVLNQVGRRMLILRSARDDNAFWFSVLQRISQVLSTSPTISDDEKDALLNPIEGTDGRIKAIKMMRQRTGFRLRMCQEIVDEWIKNNLRQANT